MNDRGLIIVNPETGETIDLTGLSDAELDDLHLYIQGCINDWKRLERIAWSELQRRARENGGLIGRRRRWTVRRVSEQRATPELIEGRS